MNNNNESSIIQNITSGYVSISDLDSDADGKKKSVTIGPFATLDLSTLNPDRVKRSTNLRDAIRAGYLRPITEEQADNISKQKTRKLREQVTKLQAESELRTVTSADGRDFEAEAINVSRADAAKMTNEITTAGHANDPVSYAVAFEIAEAQAALRGEDLTAEEFGAMTAKDSDLVRKLITANTKMVKPLAYEESHSVFIEPAAEGKSQTTTRRNRIEKEESQSPLDVAEQIDLTTE